MNKTTLTRNPVKKYALVYKRSAPTLRFAIRKYIIEKQWYLIHLTYRL